MLVIFFFQFNYHWILKLSHNPHLPITRSGARLMQNQQITRGGGGEGREGMSQKEKSRIERMQPSWFPLRYKTVGKEVTYSQIVFQ